ncbi:MAG: hypothetical protein JSW47_16355 [Phycisphaerales bacterium]|nr:MAG: hypothetical protein JSW47_16355 [Phycisphaerales bacterium]
MKDIVKNPTFYYILVPAVVALWPLLVWGVYLPRAKNSLNSEQEQYVKAEKLIEEILNLDGDRLEFAESANAQNEFEYDRAVAMVAALCQISPGNYSHSSGIIIEASGRKSQSAVVNLKGVDIAKAARFLSTIELRWANLQCTTIKLTKKKGMPDMWDVDLDFKYYY